MYYTQIKWPKKILNIFKSHGINRNMKKISKKEAEKVILRLFDKAKNVQEKNPELSKKLVKKAKRIAMHHNIKLGKLKRKFCKKCFSLFNSKNSRIRIKKKMLVIRCLNCDNIQRYKI